jgi:hypothetical protein
VTSAIRRNLDPARVPNMSLQIAVILGVVLDRAYTTPALAELLVTPDGHVLARPEGEPGPPAYVAAVANLRASLSRFGMGTGLDAAEWGELALPRSPEDTCGRLGLDLR